MSQYQHRRYCGTDWGCSEYTPEFLTNFSYFAFAEEVAPTTLNKHHQVYFVTKTRVTKKQVLKYWELIYKNVEIIPCSGSHEDNIKYIQGPYEKDGKVKVENPTFRILVDNYSPEGCIRRSGEKNEKWETALAAAKEGRFEDVSPDI